VHDALLAEISLVVRETPPPLVKALAQRIALLAPGGDAYADHAIVNSFSHPRLRVLVRRLLDAWRRSSPPLSGQSLALALEAASRAHTERSDTEDVTLVWTGPTVDGPALRRTDQALLQVIQTARQTLLVVSFAVYNIPRIAAALARAAQRGVRIQLCVESPEESRGRLAYSAVAALGEEVSRQATVYIWPYERRLSQEGRHGALHAKCAVADQDLLFVSSANLTEHALTLNMELGVLIRGGRLPGDVSMHLQRLIERGELVKVE
jgi:phosphatidylserine/phosphatidylglycerophosphate/cardiolipin synthase-like enzyme